MKKKTYVIASSLVILLATVCLNLSPDSSTRLKRTFSSFFIPLFSLQKGVEQSGNFISDNSTPRKVLLQELHDLIQSNQLLRLQLAQNQNLTQENDNFRNNSNYSQSANGIHVSPGLSAATRQIGGAPHRLISAQWTG